MGLCRWASLRLEDLLARLTADEPDDLFGMRHPAFWLPSTKFESTGQICRQEIELDFAEANGRGRTIAGIARHQEDTQGDLPGALLTWGRAFAEEYGNEDLRLELERIASLTAEWGSLAAIVVVLISVTTIWRQFSSCGGLLNSIQQNSVQRMVQRRRIQNFGSRSGCG